MKKLISLILAMTLVLGLVAGCASQNAPQQGDTTSDSTSDTTTNADTTTDSTQTTDNETSNTASGHLKVAALEAAYGTAGWEKLVETFSASHPDIEVELIIDKNLEDVIGASMKAGDYPDVVHLATGRPAGLTETFIKENGIADLTPMLDMQVPGEDITVREKIFPGFLDTSMTNPYSDGKTYLAPMFYGPCGLFYNAGLFEEKGWEVPQTWDEMWELGDKAAEEGISLFAYPTAGYFDSFFYALLNVVGGPEFFAKVTNYEEGIWDTEEGKTCLDLIYKLTTYTHPSVPANANNENYLKNQQLILDNQALFMPNGTWVIGEMADAPRAEGFEWGMTALPALHEGGDRYSFTWFEQAWIPAGAANKDAAMEWLAWMYSDEAVAVLNKHGMIQPVPGASDSLEGDQKLFYSIFDTGAKAALGGFATTDPVEGVDVSSTWFTPIDALVSGDKTEEEWAETIKVNSDKLRAALKD